MEEEKETEEGQANEKKLVQNFGIRWRRDYVNFGRPGPGGQGQLLGFLASAGVQERENVDFWTQTGVYALYDGPELVYVGRATKGNEPIGDRLAAHNRNAKMSDRWTAFSWLGFRKVNKDLTLQHAALPQRQVKTEAAAILIEGLLIEFVSPRLNNRGGDLSHIPRFAQTREKVL
jgi:hypothetical protein